MSDESIIGNAFSAKRLLSHSGNFFASKTPGLTMSEILDSNIFHTDLEKQMRELDAKPQKPWEKKRKESKSGVIRLPMTTINSLDSKTEFIPHIPGRLGLRLEHKMGSPKIKLDDRQWMRDLSRKIKEQDQTTVKNRMIARRQAEIKRRSQLVIDGLANPFPGEEHLLNHPMVRCKKVMNRIKQSDFDVIVPRKTGLKIIQTEPFDEYERTGFLFGNHKNHYLRNPRRPVSAPAKLTDEGEEEEHAPEVEVHTSPTLNLEPVRGRSDTEPGEGEDEEEEPTTEEVVTPPELPVAKSTSAAVEEEEEAESDEVEKGSNLDEEHESQMGIKVLGSKFKNLDMHELEKLYKTTRSLLVEEIYKAENEVGDPLWNMGAAVSTVYKREQVAANEFANKKLRKILDNQN